MQTTIWNSIVNFVFVFCSFSAQITQWDLIFHGTETPAQPNDPFAFGIDGAVSNEMDQNTLDFDGQTASGQWRNMQQVS